MLTKICIVVMATSVLIAQADANDPMPGMRCESERDCNTDYTRMSCIASSFNNPYVCTCEKFRATSISSFNWTAPVFHEETKRCVVKKGDACEIEKTEELIIPCEPYSRCNPDLIPEDEAAGICSRATSPVSVSVSAFVTILISIFIGFDFGKFK